MPSRLAHESIHPAVAPAETPAARVLRFVCAAAIIVTPIYISATAHEGFREPKEIMARLFALIALPVLPLVVGRNALTQRPARTAYLLGGAILLWTTFCAWIHPLPFSRETVGAAWIGAILFFAFVHAVSNRDLRSMHWLLVPGITNSIVALVQTAGFKPIPVVFQDGTRPITGLLGNANDVGTTLCLIAIAAMILVRYERGYGRFYVLAATAVILCGIVASQTATAMIALAAGTWSYAMIRLKSVKARALVSAAILATAIVVVAAVPGLRARVRGAYAAQRAHRYNELLSNRVEPFLVAWEMFRTSPVTGLGPSGFSAHYFAYKIAVDDKYRSILPYDMASWSLGRVINFGETHNEYLQIAAELGVVGLILFACAIVFVARQARTVVTIDEAGRYARDLALPAAVTFAVLCFAQFPLRLAAARVVVLFIAAVCVAWPRGARE